MRSIKKIIVAFTFASLALVGAACELEIPGIGNKKPLSRRVENFEVEAQDTVEIGEYYQPKLPAATLDGEKAVVSVSAKQNGKDLVFNGSNALLVEDFEDITLTYTIAEDGQKLEKSTVLKVQDTIAPYIVTNTLPATIYRGVTFAYADYIRIGDLSGTLSESSITLADQNGDELAAENGELTLPENSAVEEITFSISAKDGKNNLAEKTITLPVENAAIWDKPLDFAALDVTLDISKVTAITSGTSAEAVEKDGETALKIAHSAAWSGKNKEVRTTFKFTENITNYTCFDYIKLVVSAKANCNIDIPRAMQEGASEHIKFTASAEESEKMELFYDMSLINSLDKYVVSGNSFLLDIRLLEAQNKDEIKPENVEMEFYIYSFEFGYYERQVLDERSIDTTEFGIQADEILSVTFTPEDGGEGQAVDLNAWKPQKGTLTITLKKDAYRTTTVEIPIDPVTELVNNGADNDTDVEFAW